MSVLQRLVLDAGSLGVSLAEADAERLIRLLDELDRWNRTYNLTAIREREAMVTHHLLDSLAVHADLRGTTVADVGTGAGFPGLPLAVTNPAKAFTLIDSSGKKIRFVNHAAHALELTNVQGLQARVESLTGQPPFATVVARAFAALPQMLEQIRPLCDAGTRVLAMKGRWPQSELDAIPSSWRVQHSRELHVPGLAEARCVIALGLVST